MRGPISNQQDQSERDRSRYEEDPNRRLTTKEESFLSAGRSAFQIQDEEERAKAFRSIFKSFGDFSPEPLMTPEMKARRERRKAEYETCLAQAIADAKVRKEKVVNK